MVRDNDGISANKRTLDNGGSASNIAVQGRVFLKKCWS